MRRTSTTCIPSSRSSLTQLEATLQQGLGSPDRSLRYLSLISLRGGRLHDRKQGWTLVSKQWKTFSIGRQHSEIKGTRRLCAKRQSYS